MERSREFIEGLRRELPVWKAEGIVTEGAARALVARYDLEPTGITQAPFPDRTGPFAAAAAIAVALALGFALLLSGIGDGVLLPLTALAAAANGPVRSGKGAWVIPVGSRS